jgi:hypothetical protein
VDCDRAGRRQKAIVCPTPNYRAVVAKGIEFGLKAPYELLRDPQRSARGALEALIMELRAA